MTNNKRRRLAKAAARAARSSASHDSSLGSPEGGNRRTRRNRQFGHDRAGMNGPSYLQRVAAEQAATNGPEATALIADAAEAVEVFGDDVLEQAQRDAALAAALVKRPRKPRVTKAPEVAYRGE